MAQHDQHQQHKPQEPHKPADDSNVWVLMPLEDKSVCTQFWDDKYPHSKARLVTELKMQRLTSEHVLVVLTRMVPDRPKFTRLDGGYREALPSEMPVRMSRPVKLADHWTEEGEDGRLDYLAVVRELGPQIVPCSPAYRPDEMTLKINIS